MKKRILYATMSALMFTWVSCGDGRKDSTEAAEDQNEETVDNKKEDDAEFAVEAADAGMLEVQLGTLATTKASSPEVKKYAQMMVDDHTKANNELKALAQQKNITLPTTLSDEKQRRHDNFNDKTGADFDKDYIDQMVKDHRDVIDDFEDESDKGNDAELKSWATSKLTTLRHHLEEAERIQEALKKNDNKNP
jgi:putative membrane protein